MRPIVKQWIGGAFGLIALFLVLAHYTGASRVIGALGSTQVNIFKTLQGR